jgi:hypothetical protein
MFQGIAREPPRAMSAGKEAWRNLFSWRCEGGQTCSQSGCSFAPALRRDAQ